MLIEEYIHTDKLRVVSLFSGIGGLDLGLQRAGMEILVQVEKDEYCRQVLGQNFSTTVFSDIRDVVAGNLPEYDVLVGGFPCQDISLAGKGEGIEGERSGLWREMFRFAEETQPKYIIVENVKALVNRGLKQLLTELAAMRYDAEWTCLSAAAFGAPHLRDRLFLVAYSQCAGLQGNCRQRDTEARRTYVFSPWASDVVSVGIRRPGRTQQSETPGRAKPENKNWWAVEPNVARMVYGVPRRMDRIKGLGNSVVPQVAQFVGEAVVKHWEYCNADK